MAEARADEFNAMRLYANGRYLDANRPGKFDASRNSQVVEEALRNIRVPSGQVN